MIDLLHNLIITCNNLSEKRFEMKKSHVLVTLILLLFCPFHSFGLPTNEIVLKEQQRDTIIRDEFSQKKLLNIQDDISKPNVTLKELLASQPQHDRIERSPIKQSEDQNVKQNHSLPLDKKVGRKKYKLFLH